MAISRGVVPSVLPWSLLAPDSTKNRTTWNCPKTAAMSKGVAPSVLRAWSLLAPDSTRNRTTSNLPPAAAHKATSCIRWPSVRSARSQTSTGSPGGLIFIACAWRALATSLHKVCPGPQKWRHAFRFARASEATQHDAQGLATCDL